MAKGAAWTVSMRFAVCAIGLVSMVILARLLVPADFGLVAQGMPDSTPSGRGRS